MQGVTEISAGSRVLSDRSLAPRNKKLDEATRSLVGTVFYGTLLKTMRKSNLKGKFGHGGRGEEAFGAQLDAILAERAGKGTKNGLAAALYKHLERQQQLVDAARRFPQAGGLR